MTTIMESSTMTDNKYENNMLTCFTIGNVQFSLRPSIPIKDGRVCFINELSNKSLEVLTEEANKTITVDDSTNKILETVTTVKEQKLESFSCEACNMTFNKIHLYKRHVLNHRNMKKYKCEHCYESFNVEDNYKIHLAIHSKGPPTCPICNRKFHRLASLKAHLIMHQVEDTYTCQQCLAEFEKLDDYTKHMEKHNIDNTSSVPNSDSSYVCSYCNYSFQDADEYKEHVSCHIKVKKLVYNNKKCRKKLSTKREFPYKCSTCGKTFAKLCLLERHLRIHSGEKPFVCNFCNRGFAQKGTLKIHTAKHTGIKPFKCYLCSAKFCQKGNLRVHVERAHTAPSNGEKLYTCNQCTCIFKKVASLNAHITRSHSGIKKSEISDVLDKLKELQTLNGSLNRLDADKALEQSLPNESIKITEEINNVMEADDKSNYTTIHSNINGTVRKYIVKHKKIGTIRWYICSFCYKEFKKPSDLIRHIRTHTKEKPFKCLQCDMQFTLKSTLVTHIKTHLGKKEYACILCKKVFSSPRSLNIHSRKHDKNAKPKHYKCTECNKIFNSITKANVHMAIHDNNGKGVANKEKQNEFSNIIMKQPLFETVHGYLPVAAPKPKIPSTELEQYKNRQFKCEICTAAFTRPVHLRRHILIHTGEKKFKCDSCAKTFYTSYALKEHVNFHNGIKNFVCKVCNKKFVTSTILKRHFTMHTTQKPYVCPYCEKRFKSVTLCRRHIKIHKRDLNMQLQALSETGELTISAGETSKIIDFTDALSDNVFTIPDIAEGHYNPASINVNPNVSDNFKSNTSKELKLQTKTKKSKEKCDLGNNTAINDVQELEKQNASYLNDNNFDSSVISTTNENIAIEENIIEGASEQNMYSTIYVNGDNLQVLTTNDYNSLLAHSKLENNDSLFFSTLQELQDSNIFLPLSQTNDYSTDTHNFDTFNSNLILNTINDLSIGDKETVQLLPSINEITQNQVTHSFNIENEAVKIDTQKQILSIDDMNLSENLIFSNDVKSNDLHFFQNLQYSLTTTDNDHSKSKTKQRDSLQFLETNNFHCSTCKVVFKTLNDVQKHVCIGATNNDASNNMDTGLISEVIEEKNESCTNAKNVKLKEKSKGQNEDKIMGNKCTTCDKTFATKHALYRHMTVHNYKKQTENICSYCKKVFKKPSDLQRHVRIHTGEKPFKCEKCNKSFTLKSTRDSHYRTHNPGSNRQFSCSVCNFYLCSKSSLKTHMLRHTGAKPYPCNVCPARFRTSGHRKSHLENHMKNPHIKIMSKAQLEVNSILSALTSKSDDGSMVHDDIIKTPALEVVANELESNQDLHLTIAENGADCVNIAPLFQHLQNGVFLLNDIQTDNTVAENLLQFGIDCTDDEVSLVNISTLEDNNVMNLSKITETEELDSMVELKNDDLVVTEDITRPFKCDVCDKRFQKKSVLTKHVKIHGVNLPYSCSKCKKGFVNEDILEKHLRSHLGYRPFSCQLCNNSFGEEGSLKIHLKRIHNM